MTDTRWKPGQSGNPTGRPKIVSEVRDLARQHSTFAVEVLVKIAGNGRAPAMARVAAATQLLDRGFGRPPQSLEVQSRSPLADLSTAALLTLAHRLVDRAPEMETVTIEASRPPSAQVAASTASKTAGHDQNSPNTMAVFATAPESCQHNVNRAREGVPQ